MRILVLGGAGAMARVTVRDLLHSRAVDAVGVADLQFDRVTQAVRDLPKDRAEGLTVDVRDRSALRDVLKDWDVVINSTWYELNLGVMDAAIASGVHYIDLGGLYHMTLKQLGHDQEAKDAGVTCLVGMGSTPGTMNLMAAYGASKLDRIETVKLRSAGVVVSGGSSDSFVPPYAIRTLLDEFSFDVPVWRGGGIRMVPPLSGHEILEMPDPVGTVEGYLTIHSELATLPQNLRKGVRELDFAVGFPPDFLRTLVSLVRLGFASKKAIRVGDELIVPYQVTSAVIDAVPRPREPILDVDAQRCEMSGTRGGEPVTVILDCISRPNLKTMIDGGSVGTGTPPSIAAQWIAAGKIRVRGVIPPEIAVDPLLFFQELGADERTIEVWERGEPDHLLSKGA